MVNKTKLKETMIGNFEMGGLNMIDIENKKVTLHH